MLKNIDILPLPYSYLDLILIWICIKDQIVTLYIVHMTSLTAVEWGKVVGYCIIWLFMDVFQLRGSDVSCSLKKIGKSEYLGFVLIYVNNI